MAAVKKCLEDNGVGTLGGAQRPNAEDTDAPDRGELITQGAFIAFYSSPKRADELEGGVRQTSKEAGTDVVRHGDVTVVYLANAGRDKVEACLK